MSNETRLGLIAVLVVSIVFGGVGLVIFIATWQPSTTTTIAKAGRDDASYIPPPEPPRPRGQRPTTNPPKARVRDTPVPDTRKPAPPSPAKPPDNEVANNDTPPATSPRSPSEEKLAPPSTLPPPPEPSPDRFLQYPRNKPKGKYVHYRNADFLVESDEEKKCFTARFGPERSPTFQRLPNGQRIQIGETEAAFEEGNHMDPSLQFISLAEQDDDAVMRGIAIANLVLFGKPGETPHRRVIAALERGVERSGRQSSRKSQVGVPTTGRSGSPDWDTAFRRFACAGKSGLGWLSDGRL